MKMIAVCVTCIVLSGCASTGVLPVSVDSTPRGAHVDVDGVAVGKTPTQINLECKKHWVGVFNSPDGWAYDSSANVVTVYLSASHRSQSQTTAINPCQWKGPSPAALMFDLLPQAATPTRNVESDKHSSAITEQQRESLESLKRLRDQGVLTEAEYIDKASAVLKNEK